MHEIQGNLAELIVEGFENPYDKRGICQFCFDDLHVNGIQFTIEPDNIYYQEAIHPSPDATITLPTALLVTILEQKQFVDFRDPEIIGNIQLQGDQELIRMIGNLMIRPDVEVERRFQFAEEKAKAQPRITEVRKVDSPTEEQILETLYWGQPMIATNFINHWPLSWNFNDLKQRFAEVPVKTSSVDKQETMAEFMEKLENPISGEKQYTEGSMLPEAMLPFFPPPIGNSMDFIAPQIWLGTAKEDQDPVSSLHHDPRHAFLGQLIGRKKMILYSPDQADYLYPHKTYNNYQPCWVKPSQPDYERFPKFQKAQPIEVVLHPGEMIIQPIGWFHDVYALDPVLSISYIAV